MQCFRTLCCIQAISNIPRMHAKRLLFVHQALFNSLISNSQSIHLHNSWQASKPLVYPLMANQEELARLLQKRRQKKRQTTEKYSPSNVSLQILGSGMYGSPSALYLSTDHAKYLFNCGEGTQRLAHEHHSKLGKLEHVLFTTPNWKNMGGLPGMALTLQDGGVPKLNLHGPKGMVDIFDAVKRFVFLTNLDVTEVNCDENQVYKDTSISIRYVHLKKVNTDSGSDSDESVPSDDTDYYAHEYNENGKRPALWQKSLPPVPKSPDFKPTVNKVSGCVAYICKLSDKAGMLDYAKCVEMGVTPGPLLGQLKAGFDVTLPNGTVVRSSEVCEEPKPGPTFIVLECPDKDYLDSLLQHKAFDVNQNSKDDTPGFIIHFTPDNIMKHPQYIKWMTKFSPDTHHIIINEGNNCLNYEALHRLQQQLNLIHPTIFPLLHEIENPTAKTDVLTNMRSLKIHRASTLNTIYLRPDDGLDASIVVTTNQQANTKEVIEQGGFTEARADLQVQMNDRADFIKRSPAFPKIVMLGTGSCIPNKVRNTSSIILRLDEDTNMLMDCGEGTIGQIIRFFGKAEAMKIIKNIKAIYISHLHADHHLGLLSILQERRKLIDTPVFLLAPKQIESWLRLYHRKFEKIDSCYILVPLQGLLLDAPRITADAENEMKKSIRISDVNTAEVRHCLHSFAVAFTLQSGQKIVYSGDTKPCQSVVALGQDCDLLIHEATMEDGLEQEADKKMHSTISQALKIGEQTNAKFILLTHFSQRYSKMPRLPENDNLNLDNVGIAFDNMQFSFAELSLLPLFYPCYRIMFSDFCNTLEEKARRRTLRLKEKRSANMN